MSKSKEEKMLEEIQSMVEELKKAKSETSATVAVDRKPKIWLPSFGLKKRLIWIIAIILILAVIVFSSIFSIKTIFGKEGQVVNTVSSFAEQIQDLASLTTSKAYMKAVVEQEDNELFGKKIDTNIPGTKRTTLIIIPGEVTAGVDLSSITESDIKVNEDTKTIHLVLPKAEMIQQPSLYFEEAQIYSSEGLFRGSADIEEGYAMAELAQNQIMNEAIEQGLLTNAEQQAEAVLEKFIEQLGYKVNIEYDY